MTEQEMRDTIRRMLADWMALTREKRVAALELMSAATAEMEHKAPRFPTVQKERWL